MTNQAKPSQEEMTAFYEALKANVPEADPVEFDEAKYYARFPEEHHSSVEQVIVYCWQELLSGELSDEGFDEHVRDVIKMDEEMRQQEQADLELFRQIEELLETGEFEEPHRSVLASEISQGTASVLMRFIRQQQLHGARDAALSFLAWHYTCGLVLLEEQFGLNLDSHRDVRDSHWLASKEALTIKRFSVAAQQLLADE